MSYRYSIRVQAEAKNHKWVDLLSILEGLLPVNFHFSADRRSDFKGEILAEGSVGVEQGLEAGITSLEVPPEGTASGENRLINIAVQFTEDPDVAFPFRGRSLRTNVLAEPVALALRPGERSLANCQQGPVWASSERAGVKHFRSAFPLPVVPSHCALQDVLGGHRFLEMVPLLSWLRSMGAIPSYHGLPLSACFVFDDPNLHWPSYGFVDYRKLVVQAERENYHVAFATIPLDTWYTHRETAGIFRQHPDRLSLAVHGNNHTKRELGRTYSKTERSFLLRQAIQRIERLENRTGLAVSRVMVPPHGACSEEMLAALPLHGFESACISHGSLRAHNSTRSWAKNIGYLPSEFIEGCPVLPRWGLTGDTTTNSILLAAFLHQAIILRGHQKDLRDGIELLDGLAQFVNGLGPVNWSNLTELSRSSHQWRTAGATVRLKPLGRKVDCSLPTEMVECAVNSSVGASSGSWKIQGANGSEVMASKEEYVSFPESMDGATSVEIVSSGQTPAGKVSERTPAGAFLRRLITEGRDRFLCAL
jgi:hypothetical protein